MLYYFLATLLPIDKFIGKLYPLFGVVLVLMAVMVGSAIIVKPQYIIPEIQFRNFHPDNLEIFPFMFVTVARGAISGFHATQSPMIAKCITGERRGRKVFYGAMICEAVIALIWAAGVTYYGSTKGLQSMISSLGQSSVVYDISTGLLGILGGAFAVVGVVVCPITSGDTAFRSARLILSEWTELDQKMIRNRLIVTIPLLVAGSLLTQMDFNALWLYFSWTNQTLAMISLWISTSYLVKQGKGLWPLITAIPASFMTSVSVTYILMAPEGFLLGGAVAYWAGLVAAAGLFVYYLIWSRCAANTDSLAKA